MTVTTDTRSIAPLTVTVEEAASIIGCKRSKMFELIRTGAILSVKIGRSRRIEIDECRAYVARQRDEIQP